VVCPKLEKIVIKYREALDIEDVIGMAAARASVGAKLKSVRFVRWNGTVFAHLDVLGLGKHVLHVECGPRVDGAGISRGDTDEGGRMRGRGSSVCRLVSRSTLVFQRYVTSHIRAQGTVPPAAGCGVMNNR